MYSTPFKCECDHRLSVMFKTGAVQGMGTSGVLYNTGKWAVEKQTIQDLQNLTKLEFGITFKIDYHDDGVVMFHYKYLKQYIESIVKNYKNILNIRINKAKSKVVANTDDEQIKSGILITTTDISNPEQSIKTDFDGNIFFCGVPHGTKEFICSKMLEYCKKLDIH